MNGLSLYVHLPWCVKKCPYCDFNSHAVGSAAPTTRYVDALISDLRRERERSGRQSVETVFLGGGTPSLFPPGEIHRLLDAVRGLFDVDDDAEITMEANPGTVECGAPDGYREAGVNRLSIGAQSFDDDMLGRLGRIHTSTDIRRAFEDARAAGFDDINLDLMHGLPGQKLAAAMDDLGTALELGPEHISWYQLTLEPNTVFFARPPRDLPDDDEVFDIQAQGRVLLTDGGFRQYEVSAYARQDRRCRHNLNYWRFGDYLAVGAGAHGKFGADGRTYRYRKFAHPEQYLRAIEGGEDAVDRLEPLGEQDLIFEFMLNALRLSDGFHERDFVDRTGLSAQTLARAAETAREKALLERDESGVWRPTGLGSRFLNDLLESFLYSQD